MEKKHKDLLQSKRLFLVQNLDLKLGDVGDALVQENVINLNDLERLRSLPATNRMASEFLTTMLPKRGPKAFESFLRALVKGGQEFIAEELDPQLTAQIQNSEGDQLDARPIPVTQSINDIIQELSYETEAYRTPTAVSKEIADNLLRNEAAYKMSARVRGHAVIINNFYFVQERNREGSQRDIEELQKLFEGLHFKVILRTNLEAQEIENVVEEQRCFDHSQYDAFVLFILTHGSNGNISGSDSKSKKIDDIADIIGRCDTLRRKPKMIFIQACRVDRQEADRAGIDCDSSSGMLKLMDTDETDARGPLHHYTDIFLAYATIPGFYAYRNTLSGSWFVRFFVYVCSTTADKEDLASMMIRVNSLLERRPHADQKEQLGETQIKGLTKKIFFFPQYFR